MVVADLVVLVSCKQHILLKSCLCPTSSCQTLRSNMAALTAKISVNSQTSFCKILKNVLGNTKQVWWQEIKFDWSHHDKLRSLSCSLSIYQFFFFLFCSPQGWLYRLEQEGSSQAKLLLDRFVARAAELKIPVRRKIELIFFFIRFYSQLYFCWCINSCVLALTFKFKCYVFFLFDNIISI